MIELETPDGALGDPPWSPAERACQFVAAEVRAVSRHLFRQGRRKPPLTCRSRAPLVRLFAEERLHRVPLEVARALVAWADGFPVELLGRIPEPREVLALQARGARCVSLLPENVPTSPHADALAFALHDLCHLDKFVDAEHHLGQVGFFACLDACVAGPAWSALEGSLDEAFRRDWHHVAADMNGSAVFLFAALKMKLKMAVRRRIARDRGALPPDHGPLTREEALAYDDHLRVLLSILDFEPRVAAAARATSARRDDPSAALCLLLHFEERGRNALRTLADGRPKCD
jgi:hypothetical protein